MKMITKILTLALAAVLCVSTAGVTASGEMERQKETKTWGDDFFGDDRSDTFPLTPEPYNVKTVNTRQWTVSGITSIEAIYGSDRISLFPSQTQEIILKEYMSEDNASYYAKTSISGSALKIQTGARPVSSPNGFVSYVELYIPAGFNGTVDARAENGMISICGISASKVTAQLENGQIGVSNFSGALDCKVQNGGVQVSESDVKGAFRTENGHIDLSLRKILGDITADAENGAIIAALPKADSFNIEASTQTGDIINDFSTDWSVTGSKAEGCSLSGAWGNAPSAKVSFSICNGPVELYPAASDGKSKYAALSESALLEYQKWEVTLQNDTLLYRGEPIRIFMDLRANNSFAYFAHNKSGTVDLKLIRGQDGAIISAALIPKEEAEVILGHLENGFLSVPTASSMEQEKPLEDISRLKKEELPDDIRASLNSCTGSGWYVILAEGRRYIYFNNLPNNYAYQYNPEKSTVTVMDIGNTKEGYVLLSIPAGAQLSVQYNSKSVNLTEVSVS